MARPRILIPTPTSFDEPYNAQCWPEYASAITAAGGEPVRLALTHSVAEVQREVDAAQGILLPGSGADVDPNRYGHARESATAERDPLREQTDQALLEAAERSGTPLFGICLGLQSMNVFYGGTLIQDLVPVPVNHRAGRAVSAAHTALIAASTRLAAGLGSAEDSAHEPDGSLRVAVNSSHHQAVGIAGDGLRVVARCPDDGVIEALEGGNPDHWLLGVQWHPERTQQNSAASRMLFRAFVNAAQG